jgi:RNA polymerase sigma factor (sigma-70 family)
LNNINQKQKIFLPLFIENNYERIHQRLLWIGRNKLSTPEDAEDLVQETLMKLLQSDLHFKSPAMAYSYISKTFHNLKIDFYRSPKNSQKDMNPFVFDPEEILLQVPSGDDGDILQGLAEKEILEIVTRAFKELSENCRKIFELLFEDEIDRKDIPGILGLRKEAFENRLYQCRKHLKKKLKYIL